MTGRASPGMSEFDDAMLATMEKWHIPGGQLAIAKDGRLIVTRGYGYADVGRKQLVEPDSLFRIGSVSKTLTTAGILKLIESGRLHLDDKAFSILSHLRPPHDATLDPRILDITVQQLLQHQGGWNDHEPSFTTPFTREVAAALRVPDPPECESVIRYQFGVRLDFTPGSKSSYSNFGFCVLGRIIEAVASKGANKVSYEQFIKQEIWLPAGVTRARIGGTLLADRGRGEVRYYGPQDQSLIESVYPGRGVGPFAYGGVYLRSTDSAGGWVSSAEDLVRFATALDGQRGPAILRPATIRLMLDTWIPFGTSTGLCWTVAKRDNGVDFWHTGALKDSNASWLVRTSEGVALAFVFNSLPRDYEEFFHEVIPEMLALVKAPRTWPTR